MKNYLSYALGEILLVMIGILLALQVNNWNQKRLQALEEDQILAAISVEMDQNRFRNERGMSVQKEILAASERLLVYINTPSDRPSYDQVDQDLQKLTNRWFGNSSSSVYDVLVGSGELGLLSSVELRNKLAYLKRQMELLSIYEGIQADFIDNQFTPFLNRSMDRLPGVAEKMKLVVPRTRNSVNSSIDDLLETRDFSNLLVDLVRVTQPVIQAYERISKAISEISILAAGS